MYDRPTAAELIDAARQHIEQNLIPVARATNHKLYFQTLVAVNVLKIVERELALRDGHQLAEWARLNAIMGDEPLPSEPAAIDTALDARISKLCEAIRAGDYDDDPTLFEYLKATATEQLEVANPRLLQILAAEDASTS